MCGSIGLAFKKIPEEELKRFFAPQEIESFRQGDEVICAFWAVRPVLPVREGGRIRLYDWGNREDKIRLPKTGWARLESLAQGKWGELKPKEVSIPADRGCEKRIWFDLGRDIAGLLAERNGIERVYMITEPATPKYKALTHHDRMPRLAGC